MQEISCDEPSTEGGKGRGREGGRKGGREGGREGEREGEGGEESGSVVDWITLEACSQHFDAKCAVFAANA